MELLWNPNYTLFLRGPSCKIVYDSVISKVKLVLLTLGIPNQSQLDCIINSITNFTVKNIHPIQSKFMPRSPKRSVSTGLPVMFPVLFLVFHCRTRTGLPSWPSQTSEKTSSGEIMVRLFSKTSGITGRLECRTAPWLGQPSLRLVAYPRRKLQPLENPKNKQV